MFVGSQTSVHKYRVPSPQIQPTSNPHMTLCLLLLDASSKVKTGTAGALLTLCTLQIRAPDGSSPECAPVAAALCPTQGVQTHTAKHQALITTPQTPQRMVKSNAKLENICQRYNYVNQ